MAPTDQTEKLEDLLKGVRVVMLTSTTDDGSLHSRPMALQSPAADGSLWFIASLASDKAHEIRHDAHVNLSFIHGDDRWVSVSGRARVLRDPQKIKELWSPFAKAWFPNGPDDPDVGLVQVTLESAEYWEATSPRPIRVLQHLAAAATGRTPDVGDSGTLDLKR